MNAPFYTLVYNSTRSDTLDEVGLLRVLYTCQKNNAKNQLKSLLVSYGNYFVQCIQGDKYNVNHVFSAIKKDLRHSNVQTLYTGEFAHIISQEDIGFRFVSTKNDEPAFNFTALRDDSELLFSTLQDLADSKYLNPIATDYISYKKLFLEAVQKNLVEINEKYKH